MKVLITGFEPFGGENINPAWEAVRRIPDTLGEVHVVKLQIPTVFRKSIEVLEKAVDEEGPDLVICIGQAGGRFDISVERLAINMDDARIPDNENNAPVDEPIYEDGENAYFSSLPIKAIVEAIRENNIPASISNTAGTYVCNHIMYGLLYLIDKKYQNIRGGFIHVPFIPEQIIGRSNVPFMSLEHITKALTIAVETSARTREDLQVSGGSIC